MTSTAADRLKAQAFLAGQRERMERCIRTLHPRRIVFLGAGFLDDIPIERSIAEGAEIFCVDWMRDVMEVAYRERIIEILEERVACIVCRTAGDPGAYCRNHCGPSPASPQAGSAAGAGDRVCANFVRSGGPSAPRCGNFLPGDFPRFISSDVTQGRATSFANGVDGILNEARKPRAAMTRALRRARRVSAAATLPIDDASVDLVTSSMVASQFDFEPFTYFVKRLIAAYDPPAVKKAAKELSDLEEELRDTLLVEQMRGHCEEIVRLLRPDGRAYFSMEILHQPEAGGNWFQPKVVPKILEVLNGYFFYDVDIMPDLLAAETRMAARGGRSVIQTSILRPVGAA